MPQLSPSADTIVLVDDDRNILVSVSMALEAEGFAVRSFDDSEQALAFVLTQPPSIVVSDIKMPRLDGFELLEKIRAKSAVPVIFLTSKDGEEDELIGLKLGADDYIKKPFSQKLLIERIRALLRREHLVAQSALQDGKMPLPAVALPEGVLQVGALTLDSARHSCHWKGRPVSLTVTEFLLVKELVSPVGYVRSRDHLILTAYGEDAVGGQSAADDRTIDSHIKRLRRKFREIDPAFDQIETLYGAGYRYRDT